MDLIVVETNRYAEQLRAATPSPKRYSFIATWTPINRRELEQFLGLMFLMGIIHKPTVGDYWSTDPLMATPLFSGIMSRSRFQAILKFLHFNDNSQRPSCDNPDRDRLYKLRLLLDHLSQTFEAAYRPEREIAIDESLNRKRHPYGSYYLCWIRDIGSIWTLLHYCQAVVLPLDTKDISDRHYPRKSNPRSGQIC